MMRYLETTATVGDGADWNQAWDRVAEAAIRRGIGRLLAHDDPAREDVVQEALCRLLIAAQSPTSPAFRRILARRDAHELRRYAGSVGRHEAITLLRRRVADARAAAPRPRNTDERRGEDPVEAIPCGDYRDDEERLLRALDLRRVIETLIPVIDELRDDPEHPHRRVIRFYARWAQSPAADPDEARLWLRVHEQPVADIHGRDLERYDLWIAARLYPDEGATPATAARVRRKLLNARAELESLYRARRGPGRDQ